MELKRPELLRNKLKAAFAQHWFDKTTRKLKPKQLMEFADVAMRVIEEHFLVRNVK
jgi:hypothetical protein